MTNMKYIENHKKNLKEFSIMNKKLQENCKKYQILLGCLFRTVSVTSATNSEWNMVKNQLRYLFLSSLTHLPLVPPMCISE